MSQLTSSLDPFHQLDVRRPAVIPAPTATGPFSAGRGLLTERQFESPAAYEQALSLVTAHRRVVTGGGTALSSEPEFFIRLAAELAAQELRRSPSTLGEELTIAAARPPEPMRQERDVIPCLLAVRRFIEAEHLSAARHMLEAAPVHILNDPLLGKLRSVLAPPALKRVQKRDVDRSLEYEWLRTEGRRYRGRWVALEGSKLLAVSPSLRELREQLRTMLLAHPPLLHRVADANVQMLVRADGSHFSTGRCRFSDHDPGSDEPTAKILVKVEPESLDLVILAQLDTGAPWSILDAQVAEALSLLDGEGEPAPLSTRFGILRGRLERIRLYIVADEGDTLSVDATVWVSRDWPGGTFLGYGGLLERIRFAVDPGDNSFYFGPS